MDASQASGGQYDSMRLAWDDNGSLDEESSSKTLTDSTGVQATGKIYWAGPMSTYFLAAVIPSNPHGVTMMGRQEKPYSGRQSRERKTILAPGESREIEISYWIGPKRSRPIECGFRTTCKSIDLGFFPVLPKVFLWLLEFFQKYVHNWGIAIILLTILIKAVFWPLTAKAMLPWKK